MRYVFLSLTRASQGDNDGTTSSARRTGIERLNSPEIIGPNSWQVDARINGLDAPWYLG